MLKNFKNEPVNQAGQIASTLPEQNADQAVQLLLRILYLREYETEVHTQRLAEVTVSLAQKAGVSETELEGIRIGALLHDVGKVAIPDKILFKLGKLTDGEWEILKRHPLYGYELMAPIPGFRGALDIPYCHHEHWDGTGYPRGLKREEIPLAARVFSIVDVWDSLSSDRPYRPAWKQEDIKFFLKEQSGIMFDPTLLGLFMDGMGSAPGKSG
jgi:HD-GYP domain-containing protein (c-di-GMP phosphodiesterase class II)